nr:unnamed protein product [Callosobruchus chinensis]
MNSQVLPRSHSLKLLGVSITENMKYFSPSKTLTLYKAQVRPGLEYCSHIWGAAAPATLSILDAIQRRAIRLIGYPTLTCHLQPLSHRRAVGDRSFFYRYSNGFCSSELMSIIPLLSRPARCIRGTSSSYSKAVRTERYGSTFVPRVSRAGMDCLVTNLLSLRVLAY